MDKLPPVPLYVQSGHAKIAISQIVLIASLINVFNFSLQAQKTYLVFQRICANLFVMIAFFESSDLPSHHIYTSATCVIP